MLLQNLNVMVVSDEDEPNFVPALCSYKTVRLQQYQSELVSLGVFTSPTFIFWHRGQMKLYVPSYQEDLSAANRDEMLFLQLGKKLK